MKTRAAAAVLLMASSGFAFADAGPLMEEVTIVGDQANDKQVTGAAQYIGPAALETMSYSDVQRILRMAPGVSIQVEDGYGLRPNISIRGVATERSGRITLLEDNVLIAPAPYSAPSAYYFPTTGRLHAIEILKGPAAITQGPYTIGGAMNMISTPVPLETSGMVKAEAGGDNTYRVHASYGGTADNGLGVLLETHQWQSDGYQDIDRSSSDSGLDVEDYMLKVAYSNAAHSLELKLQYADQNSDQSYLGLTDVDFNADPFRRYGLSALDNIQTNHDQQILRYRYAASDALSLSVTAYNNEHERSWFKTEGIDFDGSATAESFSRTSWSSVVNAVNTGSDVSGVDVDTLRGILNGQVDTPVGSIQLRANNRVYYSRGVQFGLDWQFAGEHLTHQLQAGIRLHQDEEDRLQRNSTYHQTNGQLVLDDLGLLGNAGNRVQEADALAIHVYDRIEVGNWVLTPGIRYEDIEQSRTRWEIRDGRTTNPASRADANFRDSRKNDTQVWLPGMGVLYSLNETTTLLAGVHKGFTAPSNAPGAEEEDAINFEAGVRYAGPELAIEAVYFLSDYDNLLGVCTASSGSNCAIGDAFNGDAATVQGLEILLEAELARQQPFSLPLSFSYTFIDSEFDSDVADTAFFGDVNKGDPIPYIPEHQFNVQLGYLWRNWSGYAALSYVDEVCVRASCGTFEKTDDSLTLDLSLHYALNSQIDVYAKIENLTDEADIMGRQPYGARPNKDRTATLGVRFDF